MFYPVQFAHHVSFGLGTVPEGSLDCELSEKYIILYVSNVHNKEYAPLKQNRCMFLYILVWNRFFWRICNLWPANENNDFVNIIDHEPNHHLLNHKGNIARVHAHRFVCVSVICFELCCNIFQDQCILLNWCIMKLIFSMSCLSGTNWVHFTHRPECTATLNSNFAISRTWNCFRLDLKNHLS